MYVQVQVRVRQNGENPVCYIRLQGQQLKTWITHELVLNILLSAEKSIYLNLSTYLYRSEFARNARYIAINNAIIVLRFRGKLLL